MGKQSERCFPNHPPRAARRAQRAAMPLARALARATRARATTATTATTAWRRARATATDVDGTTGTDGDDGARARARTTARADDREDDRAATAMVATPASARAEASNATLSDGGLGSRVLEMWLMAVPKRKVTPSRRKRRNQFKRLPFVESVVRCGVCGKVNLPHVRCCDVAREGRREERGEAPEA